MRRFGIKARLRRLRQEEGSALVELAIAAFLLFSMVLGAAELGQMAWAAIEVSNAAHAGAQFASTSHKAASDYSGSAGSYTGGIVTAATGDSDTSRITVNLISPVCTCANSTYSPTSCSDNSTCQSHNTQMLETVLVQTKVSYVPLVRWPGGPNKITMYGNAMQRVSNQ